jgi:hypothetical protein
VRRVDQVGRCVDHILQDLQRDLKQRAKMHAPLDRKLPFVRREPVREYLQFLWHYRLRGDCRRSFGTAITSPQWEQYFETLPEVGIPQPLIDTIEPLLQQHVPSVETFVTDAPYPLDSTRGKGRADPGHHR